MTLTEAFQSNNEIVFLEALEIHKNELEQLQLFLMDFPESGISHLMHRKLTEIIENL
jgi:hypothetical protein